MPRPAAALPSHKSTFIDDVPPWAKPPHSRLPPPVSSYAHPAAVTACTHPPTPTGRFAASAANRSIWAHGLVKTFACQLKLHPWMRHTAIRRRSTEELSAHRNAARVTAAWSRILHARDIGHNRHAQGVQRPSALQCRRTAFRLASSPSLNRQGATSTHCAEFCAVIAPAGYLHMVPTAVLNFAIDSPIL